MATTISSGTQPYKLGSPPDFGTLYSGRALDFDGVTDYVDCGDIANTGDTFTWSAWVKYNNSFDTYNPLICRDGGTQYNPLIRVDGSGNIEFRQYSGSEVRTDEQLSIGNWYNIVGVCDNLSISIYLDGSLIKTGSFANSNIDTGNIRLGKYETNYSDMILSNAQIWDKAWSLSDVQYAYTHPEKLITDNSAVTSGTTISNLKAWYPMTEGTGSIVYDGSGNGNHGTNEVGADYITAQSEPLIPQTALMGMSKSMVFNGIDDYVDCGDISEADFGTNDFSISAWIKYPSDTEHRGIISKDTGGSGIGWQFYKSTAHTIRFRNAISGDYIESTNIADDGVWHNVIYVRNNGDNYFYIDAISETLSKEYLDGTSNYSSSHHVKIGVRGTNFSNGNINEVSIFSSALTLAQIQELFNDGVAFDLENNTLTGSPTLVGYWRNDGASTWTDRSGNGNHGTVSDTSPDTILLPEGTTSGKDLLGFPLTHPNSGWLNLSGSEYVECGESSSLNITGGLTLEAWVKTVNTESQYIIARDDSTTRAYYIAMNTSGDALQMRIDSGSVNAYVRGSTAINDGNWHHVVGVYIPSTSITLYLDQSTSGKSAEATETSTIPSSIESGVEEVFIGQSGLLNADLIWVGEIDEAKIYNRALSTAEIAKNYKHGKSKHS